MSSTLTPTDRELILRYADMTCRDDLDLLRQIRDEIAPTGNEASNLLSTYPYSPYSLQPLYSCEQEFAEILRQVFASVKKDYAALQKTDRAIRAFIQKAWGREMQIYVFECIFVMLLWFLDKAESIDDAFEREFKQTLRELAKNCSATFWRVDDHTIRIRWQGDPSRCRPPDQHYIEFWFPPDQRHRSTA